AALEHANVQLVAVPVRLARGPELVRQGFAVQAEAHRVVQDRRNGGLDGVDRAVAVLVERGPGGEPDVDRGRIAAGVARARVDPRDRVADDLGQEPGAGDDAVADAAAQVEHARPLRADRDRDAGPDGGRGPADALRPALVDRFAGGEQLADAGDVLLHPGARRDGIPDVENGAVAARQVHEG